VCAFGFVCARASVCVLHERVYACLPCRTQTSRYYTPPAGGADPKHESRLITRRYNPGSRCVAQKRGRPRRPPVPATRNSGPSKVLVAGLGHIHASASAPDEPEYKNPFIVIGFHSHDAHSAENARASTTSAQSLHLP